MRYLMKKITYLHLTYCPYCIKANKWLKELILENPNYATLEIEKIEESKQPQLANKFDYYYVPTFFVGKDKLHEGVASKDKIKTVLDAALNSI